MDRRLERTAWVRTSLALGLALSAFAAAPPASATEPGAVFLALPVDARAAALGSNPALASPGLFGDPAGLGALPGRRAMLSHGALGAGGTLDAVELSVPLGGSGPGRGGAAAARWGLGAGLLRHGAGTLGGRGADRSHTAAASASDFAAGAGLGVAGLPGGLAAGVALKGIRGSIAAFGAATWAVDAGLSGPWTIAGCPAGWSLALRNAGPGLKFLAQRDPLPTSAAAGVSFVAARGVMLSGAFERRLPDGRGRLNAGIELAPGAFLALRGSYAGTVAPGADARRAFEPGVSGVAGGAGVRCGRLALNYAFAPGAAGNSHLVNLAAQF